MQKDPNAVNCYNKKMMIGLGIHPRDYVAPLLEIYGKTPADKAIVSRERAKFRNTRYPNKSGVRTNKFEFPFTLIVHAKGLEKTTFSFKCLESEIASHLAKFPADSIIKASYNAKPIC